MGFYNTQLNMLFLYLCLLASVCGTRHVAVKRSIDIAASSSIITDERLPKDVIPLGYEVHLEPNSDEETFSGFVKISLAWKSDAKKIVLHAHFDLNINDRKIILQKVDKNKSDKQMMQNITVLRANRYPKKTIYNIYLKEAVKQGTECILEIPFEGNIWKNGEGLFKGSYSNETYLATNLKPNNARALFPCFDEPGYKVPFTVSITRPNNLVTIFNTPLARTVNHSTLEDYVIDYFEKTPPMSTFTFGFITTKLFKINDSLEFEAKSTLKRPVINAWSLEETNGQFTEFYEKVMLVYERIENYFGEPVPLSKIDVVFIPNLPAVRSIDNWGLLIIKETNSLKTGFYDIAQELISQWIGSWITLEWWNDVHLKKALISFLATEIVMKLDGGVEFNGKYPMTTLYSLYYELSKRYPNSRITAMKQELITHKIELVIRMLNLTLGEHTLQNGVRQFIEDYKQKSFVGENFWNSLTSQAVKDGTLDSQYSVANIVSTWLELPRLPVVTVRRDYERNSAIIQQKLFLRERPHDVPDQDKMLWWIPIVLNQQDSLNFSNYSPHTWMEKRPQTTVNNLAGKDKFIIVNHEEIGPFPVNYDEHNWQMLSNFLQTDAGRAVVPTYTRAKLLHDAWNLAYAGDLSFASALNMTLFMKFERNHIVWNPVFTFIDQIGRHIDVAEVHRKFEKYVLLLLTPLYEDLGTETENEENWKADLRSLTKRFLCGAGYAPCIKEAMDAFNFWRQSSSPDLENSVPVHYFCPVFKSCSIEEYQFGIDRVIHFPTSRAQSERTLLLKTLTYCPSQPDKIERLLKVSFMEANSSFSENDQFLILSALKSSSTGYYTLFQFLSKNWSEMKEKYMHKTNLWDRLIESATGHFLTQQGLEMVQKFQDEHAGEFGSAQHIISKSLRNIKEESLWSKDNLPVIENWLNQFLSTN